MQQGALPFQYAEEKNSTGMTALAGLATYLDLFQVADLRVSGTSRGASGRWSGLEQPDGHLVNTTEPGRWRVGGDLRVLEKDEGLGRVFETQGMRQRERRALPRRWRKSVGGVCRRPQRCSDICLSSTTKRRS